MCGRFVIECLENWCKCYEATGDWWICVMISFCVSIDHGIFSTDQVKRDEGGEACGRYERGKTL